MPVAVTELSHIILDGDVVSSGTMRDMLTNRTFMYGEGCFDTLRSYNGGFLRPEEHLRRLQKGMSWLSWDVPEPLRDVFSFVELLTLYLKSNGLMQDQARVRIQVWNDDKTAGFRPGNPGIHFIITGSHLDSSTGSTSNSIAGSHLDSSTGSTSNSITGSHLDSSTGSTSNSITGSHLDSITGSPLNTNTDPPLNVTDRLNRKGVSLITSRIRRIPTVSLPADVKWSNGINYILAAREAQQKKADDALMLTLDGYLSETTISNIFWKKGGTVYTPSSDCDLLPGITRGLLMELLRKAGIPVQTGKYEYGAILDADTVWACNSVRETYPVLSIDEKQYPPDASFLGMLDGLFQKTRAKSLQYAIKMKT